MRHENNFPLFFFPELCYDDYVIKTDSMEVSTIARQLGIMITGYKQSQKEKKLCGLIPENLREDYFHAKREDTAFNLYLRFLMVTDFISGMTDSYAKNLYQELNKVR